MKMKITIVLVLLFVGLFGDSAKGQVFAMKSLSGEKEQLKLSWNQERDILRIRSLKSVFCIREVIVVETAKPIDEKYFMIIYRVRAGSGIKVRRTLILCLDNDSIYKSLQVTSWFQEEFMGFSKQRIRPTEVDVKSTYRVGTSLLGSGEYGYKLSAAVHSEMMSIQGTERNYTYDIASVLKFDKVQNVFYSYYEPVSQVFTVLNPKNGGEDSRYIHGVFPVVALGEYRYYYVENHWYERPNDQELIKLSYD